MSEFAMVKYAVERIAKQRHLDVDVVERSARHRDDVLKFVARRRSFEVGAKVDLPRNLGFDKAAVFDIAYQAIKHADIELRRKELLAVFDFTDADEINFFGISNEEARRIGAQLLRVFMHIVRGDQFLRNRVVEMALALGSSDAVLTLIEQKQNRAELISKMDSADAEQLALDLMARVERLRSGAS